VCGCGRNPQIIVIPPDALKVLMAKELNFGDISKMVAKSLSVP
jgi:hypothetical protein